MAQFGNPPWVRDVNAMSQAGVPIASLSQQPGMAATILSQPPGPTIYNLAGAGLPPPPQAQQQFNPGLAAIQQAALQQSIQLSQPGIAIPTSLASSHVATVSYPNPRGGAAGGGGQGAGMGGVGQQQKKRVFTGIVTKLHDNFGFVDEDVFFQMACVKGQIPKVGDRVLVEASYNASMPFKWNATRIQTLPNQGTPISGAGQFGHQTSSASYGASAMKPPAQLINPGVTPPPLMGGAQKSSKPGIMLGGHNTMLGGGGSSNRNDRSRGGGDRSGGSGGSRDRDRSSGRMSSSSSSGRNRSSPLQQSSTTSSSSGVSSKRARSRSPISSRRSRRPIQPRYSVQIPKITLDSREANVMALKSRYANMYVPSDFFDASFGWVDAFPLHRPLPFCNAVNFTVMNKDVKPPSALHPSGAGKEGAGDGMTEVTDADHVFSAKVLLLSAPLPEDFYQQCIDLSTTTSTDSDNDSYTHSSSLQHPTRLLQFLVGLNGKSEPMAIGGPWSASADGPDPVGDPSVLIRTAIRTTKALTGIDLSRCTQWYRYAEVRYHRQRRHAADQQAAPAALSAQRVETVVLFLPDTASCVPSRLDWLATRDAYVTDTGRQTPATANVAAATQIQDDADEEMMAVDEEDTSETADAAVTKVEPTHYSELDPRSMKVTDLRQELECRGLGMKGLKSQLIARLLKAIKAEQDKDDESEVTDTKDEVKEEPVKSDGEDKEEAERKQKEEGDQAREQARRERQLTLPADPTIIVHPSTTAKHGRFGCTVMSLSVLLDYRPEDNKEHSFEVSLFAELFNEMLMRDCAFNIYRCLVAAPERVKTDAGSGDDKHKHGGSSGSKEEKNESSTKKRKHFDEDDRKSNDKKEDRSRDRKNNDKDRKSDEEDDNPHHEGDENKEKAIKKRSPEEQKVTDPDLLMSFVYFDLNRTGYIADSDLEEILHTLALRLSRAQIKKLVQKVVTRENLHYRKLTNRPLEVADDVEMATETATDGNVDGEENKCKKVTIDDKTLALGNRALQSCLNDPATTMPTPPATGTPSESPDSTESTMVQYKGALVDVASVMLQLERSEKTRLAVETKLKHIQQQLDSGRDALAISESTSQQLSSKLAETQKQLAETRETASQRDQQYATYEQALKRTRTSLTSVLDDLAEVTASSQVKDVKEEVN